MRVVEYDMGIYTRGEAQKKAAKKKEKAVPAPTCVATTAAAVGPNGELSGADKFFAQIAKEIDETLKNAGEFKSEVESWTFV